MEEECSLHKKCHLFDVVQVDAEDERVPKPKGAPEVDGAILNKYLALLREFLPQIVEEIEHYKATKESSIFSAILNLPTTRISLLTTYILLALVWTRTWIIPMSIYFENNPWNDYRDKESLEDEDENESPFTDFEDFDSNYEQEVASEEKD